MPRSRSQLALLYRAEQVRELDRIAIEQAGIPAAELMRRAGEAAFAVLRDAWPRAHSLLVLCGAGNNGGDGFVLATLAARAGLAVTLCLQGERGRMSEATRHHAALAEAAGVTPVPFEQSLPGRSDVVVDALLGTGIDREVSGDLARIIDAVNNSSREVLALDIPSGLNADSGRVMGTAVRADSTVTFIGRKQGLYTGAAPDCCGRIHFDALGVPAAVFEAVAATTTLLDEGIIPALLRPRSRLAHKGNAGHVLVIGGDLGFSGAARMAAEAAGRVGAGLVSVATHPDNAGAINIARPELMVRGVADAAALDPLLATASVIAIGPGLGRREWGRKLLLHALRGNQPAVVDADALNIISAAPVERESWVLTPHPGEAARLLDTTTAAVQADRFAAAQAIQRRFGGVCVLKGAGTIVDCGQDCYISPFGNPGMASGGMGDVLTGVIAGLLAQGFELSVAAALGTLVHGLAGDHAAREGERGMLAMDLMPRLRQLVNPA